MTRVRLGGLNYSRFGVGEFSAADAYSVGIVWWQADRKKALAPKLMHLQWREGIAAVDAENIWKIIWGLWRLLAIQFCSIILFSFVRT
jgi:hypothetical protein